MNPPIVLRLTRVLASHPQVKSLESTDRDPLTVEGPWEGDVVKKPEGSSEALRSDDSPLGMVQPPGKAGQSEASQEQSGGGGNEAACQFGTRFSPRAGVSNPLIQDCFLRIPELTCCLCPSPSRDTGPPEA